MKSNFPRNTMNGKINKKIINEVMKTVVVSPIFLYNRTIREVFWYVNKKS